MSNLTGAVFGTKDDGSITVTLPVVVGNATGEGKTMAEAVTAAKKELARQQEFATEAILVRQQVLQSYV